MDPEKAKLPVVAAYVSTYLPADMRHVFRQVVALSTFRAAVLTRKRRNEETYPLHKKQITLLPRPRTRELRRWWFGKVKKVPVPLTDAEVRDALYALQKHNAQVLHVYFGNIAAQLLPLLRVLRHPVVVSFHGADAGVDTENSNYRAALAEVFECAELVLARSNSLLDRLRELGCPEDKLRINRAGIPIVGLPFHQRTVAPADGAWGFLQVCRLIEKKGLPVALRAFAAVSRSAPNSRFDIVGDGPLRAELEGLAKELGIGEQVKFHGFLDLDEVQERARAAHFFLHPSQTGADGDREGVPNAMLEAMATGLPVLATRHGGIPEAVEDGVSGRLVGEGDAAALARAALDLMGEPGQYATYSQAARAVVDERFALHKTIAKLEDCYREAIAIARAQKK